MKAFLKAAIYTPLFNILIFLVWLMPNHSLGLAIIAITLIMRFIFLPSSLKQGVSQEKLRLLQPRLKELQEKHKGDKSAQSKAMMDLYKQAGTSPWGACLPMIVQLVVLILLYRVFQIGLSTSRFDLLYSWMPRPDFINTSFFGIDLSKPDLWVLPILAALAQFGQSFLALPKKDPTQKKSRSRQPDDGRHQPDDVLFPHHHPFYRQKIARRFSCLLGDHQPVYDFAAAVYQQGSKTARPGAYGQSG